MNLHSAGYGYGRLAQLFSINKKTAMQIAKGELWKHVPLPKPPELGVGESREPLPRTYQANTEER